MINVVIADNQAIFRAGVAKLLAVEEDLRIVGQPPSPEQILNALEKLRPAVVDLIDRLPVLPARSAGDCPPAANCRAGDLR